MRIRLKRDDPWFVVAALAMLWAWWMNSREIAAQDAAWAHMAATAPGGIIQTEDDDQ